MGYAQLPAFPARPACRARGLGCQWQGARKSVVIMPLHDLTPEDRLPLVVTLVDGTQVPITVTADKDRVDHQVNLFWDPETVKYLRADLENALGRERF